jgi:hypothetical protein
LSGAAVVWGDEELPGGDVAGLVGCADELVAVACADELVVAVSLAAGVLSPHATRTSRTAATTAVLACRAVTR